MRTTLKFLINNTRQLKLQQVLNGRYCDKTRGWRNTNLRPDQLDKVIKMAIEKIGGRKQAKLYWILRDKPQHWALDRIIITLHGKELYVSYCAGQDHPAELAQLRKYLYSL